MPALLAVSNTSVLSIRNEGRKQHGNMTNSAVNNDECIASRTDLRPVPDLRVLLVFVGRGHPGHRQPSKPDGVWSEAPCIPHVDQAKLTGSTYHEEIENHRENIERVVFSSTMGIGGPSKAFL